MDSRNPYIRKRLGLPDEPRKPYVREPLEYSGLVYVRPCGRGIQLLEPPVGEPNGLVELYLEHGHYVAELRFMPISPPEGDAPETP